MNEAGQVYTCEYCSRRLGLKSRPPSQTNKMNELNKAVTFSKALLLKHHWKM